MAINYTVSYTYAPATTISSSQVNTNFSDNANTWTGLEAKTKSFSNLVVDATPTSSTDVAIKSYVDKLNNYRRPVLQYASSTAVNMEAGINGTASQAQILFPDGTLRTDSTASRINLSVSQNAVLSGTAQSGIRSGSVANNTWYACYAVKVTDSTTNFVMVADTVLPIQGSYATLNSNFGTNGWVYLGYIRYGNNDGTANVILPFKQCGNSTTFDTVKTSGLSTADGVGLVLITGSSASWTYAAGTGAAQVPTTIGQGMIEYINNQTINNLFDVGGTNKYIMAASSGSNYIGIRGTFSLSAGFAGDAATTSTILLCGFIDGALGVGANPIL